MTETILTNARLVLRDSVIEGTLATEGNVISGGVLGPGNQ